MPSMLQRLKWAFDPKAIDCVSLIGEGLATVIQGYLEKDTAKFKSGSRMLYNVKYIDTDKVFANDLLNMLDEFVGVYELKENEVDEILERVQEDEKGYSLENKSTFTIHKKYMLKSIENDMKGEESNG